MKSILKLAFVLLTTITAHAATGPNTNYFFKIQSSGEMVCLSAFLPLTLGSYTVQTSTDFVHWNETQIIFKQTLDMKLKADGQCMFYRLARAKSPM